MSLVDPLIEALASVQVDDPEMASEFDAVRERLCEPLRIVLAGRVSTGKSTLLNGLLGQRIAPTDYSECTSVVTWFRYGFPQQVTVRLCDGTSRDLRLGPDGRLPRELGVPAREVRDLQVSLTNDTLRSFTLVDTPGFSAGRGGDDAEGAKVEVMDQRSRQAAATCDAMVFVLNGTLHADDLAVLRAFQEAQAGPASAVNAIGALTKADELGGGDEDPLVVAARVAKRYAARHSGDVADVVPLVGLFAETAEAGLLTERDTGTLMRLAALDADYLSRLISSVDDFGDTECAAADAGARTELLEKLGLYGVERAVGLVQEGATSAGALRRELSRLSGIERLRSSLVEGFGDKGAPLRLLWALDSVERMSYGKGLPPDGARTLRDAVERIRFDPRMHEVRELEVFDRCCSGEIELPTELQEDVRRLALDRDPVSRLRADGDSFESRRQAALAGQARWRLFRMYARPATDEVARVVLRSYQLALNRSVQ